MTQEELKTCLGSLLLDLRGNWAYKYEERMETALDLCDEIEDDTEDVIVTINEELESGFYDGRTFRGCGFYGYKSKEGMTEEVKIWCKYNLTHPEYNSPFER